MPVKELLPNLERYQREGGKNEQRNRYKDNPAYVRHITARPVGGINEEIRKETMFDPDDPRNLSLKLLHDADEGKELELLDIEVPLPAKPVERIRNEIKRRPTPSEVRELGLKSMPKEHVVDKLNPTERVVFEKEQQVRKGVIMNSLFEENVVKGLG